MSLITSPGFDKASYAIRDTDLEKISQLGSLFYFEGVPHKLVQVHTAATNNVIASNEVLYETTTENVVTNTLAAGITADIQSYAGVAPTLDASVPISTATNIYYMWMQVGGWVTAKTTGADDIVTGELVIPSGNGTCDGIAFAGATALQLKAAIGIAVADDVNAADTVAVKMYYRG